MSKRDEARDAFAMWIVAAAATSYGATWDRVTSDGIRSVVDLIVDAAKEEIRAELAEQAEERRWHWMQAAAGGPSDEILPREFWEEYRALKAKREAAGKSIDD